MNWKRPEGASHQFSVGWKHKGGAVEAKAWEETTPGDTEDTWDLYQFN